MKMVFGSIESNIMKDNNTSLFGYISQLVDELASLQRECYDLNGWSCDMQMGAPASEKDIQKAEKKNKFTFPPSYRTFLQKHNGWYLFWPDWCLAGVSGTLSNKMLADARKSIKGAVDMIEDDAEYDDEDPQERIAQLKEKERDDLDVIYPPNHPILGTDFNGGVLVFDRNRCRPDGECEIVAIDHIGDVKWRWKGFIDLLKDAIKDTKKDIREAKKNQLNRQGKKKRS
jgi:hypothetical protein